MDTAAAGNTAAAHVVDHNRPGVVAVGVAAAVVVGTGLAVEDTAVAAFVDGVVSADGTASAVVAADSDGGPPDFAASPGAVGSAAGETVEVVARTVAAPPPPVEPFLRAIEGAETAPEVAAAVEAGSGQAAVALAGGRVSAVAVAESNGFPDGYGSPFACKNLAASPTGAAAKCLAAAASIVERHAAAAAVHGLEPLAGKADLEAERWFEAPSCRGWIPKYWSLFDDSGVALGDAACAVVVAAVVAAVEVEPAAG